MKSLFGESNYQLRVLKGKMGAGICPFLHWENGIQMAQYMGRGKRKPRHAMASVARPIFFLRLLQARDIKFGIGSGAAFGLESGSLGLINRTVAGVHLLQPPATHPAPPPPPPHTHTHTHTPSRAPRAPRRFHLHKWASSKTFLKTSQAN